MTHFKLSVSVLVCKVFVMTLPDSRRGFTVRQVKVVIVMLKI